MKVKAETINIANQEKPSSSISTSIDVEDSTDKFDSNLEHHPLHKYVSGQIDVWIDKQSSDQTWDEETKYIQKQLLWFFYLRRKKLINMWLATTSQARTR